MAQKIRAAANYRGHRKSIASSTDSRNPQPQATSSDEIAEWELRIGQFRVFYNADEQELVRIEAIGFKVGNLLFIRGESRRI